MTPPTCSIEEIVRQILRLLADRDYEGRGRTSPVTEQVVAFERRYDRLRPHRQQGEAKPEGGRPGLDD